MTNNPDALVPSAKEVMQQIALAEAEEANKQARAQAEAAAEKRPSSINYANHRALPTRKRSGVGWRSSIGRSRIG